MLPISRVTLRHSSPVFTWSIYSRAQSAWQPAITAAENKYKGCISSLDTHILCLTFMVIDAYCEVEAAVEAHVLGFEEVSDFIDDELE